MYQNDIVKTASLQLAYDYSCSPTDFFGQKNKVITSVLTAKRRRFLKQPEFLKICSMGENAVINCSNEIIDFMKDIADKFSGTEIFEEKVKFAINRELSKYNKAISEVKVYYLPKTPYNYIARDGFFTEIISEENLKDRIKILSEEDFPNALLYDRSNENRKDVLAVFALNAGKIIGVAGASNDSDKLWQIGIDVLPEFRTIGIGTEIVSKLTAEIFSYGAVPYYGTWAGNLPSMRLANACGYDVAWTEMIVSDC